MAKKKKNNKKDVEIQTVEEEEEEAVEKSNNIRFECPMCKQWLEMQNELTIKKKKAIVSVSAFPSRSR